MTSEHIQPAPRSHAARVAICVATYKRPQCLHDLLQALADLSFHKSLQPEIFVVVVDNDEERTAEAVCRAALLPWPLHYFVEPRRSIAHARNRAVREAGRADFIAFIDDDEVPAPCWLDELLAAQSRYAADAVLGPVVPTFSPGVPEWVKEGGFFEKAVPVTGQTPRAFSTANALLSTVVFDRVRGFDEQFALTGGEDTQFFLRVRAAGFSIVAARSAVVHEPVSPARANMRWLLRRAYQHGNSWVLCESSVDHRMATRITRASKACARIAEGAMLVCVSPLRGRAAFVGALRTCCLGAGMLAALAGQRYEPYRSAGLRPART